MAPRILPPQAFLHQCLDYDPNTGTLTWKVRPREHFETSHSWNHFNSCHAGKIAKASHSRGYIVVHLNGYGVFKAHRLIWCWVTGNDPGIDIDHSNGKTDDNRWTNIRLATKSQNSANRKVNANNTTKLKGAYPTHDGKFQSAIQFHRKRHHLGTFPTAEQAHEAYCRAAQTLFGNFWSDGKHS